MATPDLPEQLLVRSSLLLDSYAGIGLMTASGRQVD